MTQETSASREWPSLTVIEYYILAALIRCSRHGLGIFEEVARRTNTRLVLVPGTLYSALKRLYTNELIELDEQPTFSGQRADERRKVYRLTMKGRQTIEEYVAWMDKEVQAVRQDLTATLLEKPVVNTSTTNVTTNRKKTPKTESTTSKPKLHLPQTE